MQTSIPKHAEQKAISRHKRKQVQHSYFPRSVSKLQGTGEPDLAWRHGPHDAPHAGQSTTVDGFSPTTEIRNGDLTKRGVLQQKLVLFREIALD